MPVQKLPAPIAPFPAVALAVESGDSVVVRHTRTQRIERVHDIIVESDGLMNVWAGQRVLESYKMGAKGYVNPYGNYIPRASVKFVDWAYEKRWDDVWAVQSIIQKFDAIITEGHPLYGHQCYSKALAAAAGHPVGDVRAQSGRELASCGLPRARRRPGRTSWLASSGARRSWPSATPST